MSMDWVARQIGSLPGSEPRREQFNPRPAGWIQPGATTEAVLEYLTHNPGKYTRAQIIAATGRTEKAVDWALIFLRSQGKIVALPDPRHERYLRYTAKGDA